MLTQKASVKKAFTLTELLVSMAVLGLIATLTLPHMFMSADRAKKRAVFKEAYQALAEAVQSAWLQGESNVEIMKKLNPKEMCRTSAFTEGCTTLYHFEAGQMGVKLATGVSIFGFAPDNFWTTSGAHDGVMIALEDFPKKEYFYLALNIGETSYDTTGWGPAIYPSGMTPVNTIVRPGEIKCMEQACFDMFKND